MRNLSRLLFILLCVGVAHRSVGQTNRNAAISGNFEGLSFRQFSEAIEARSSYRFYVNPTDVDSLQVHLQVTDKPLGFHTHPRV